MGAGRTAVIVGNGPGVGAAVADAFAAEGYNLAPIARDAAKLSRAADALRAARRRLSTPAMSTPPVRSTPPSSPRTNDQPSPKSFSTAGVRSVSQRTEGGQMLIPTRDNSAILFLDLQEEIVKNSRTRTVAQLELAASGLARLAALHKIPAWLSAVPPGGAYLTSIASALQDATPRMRTQTSAFADAGLVGALKSSGRKAVILSGVASEIVVQRTALDALAAGLAAYVAVDACGGVDPRTEDAAFRRIAAAGGATTSAITFAAELAGDFTTEAGGATLAIMYSLLGA